MRAEEVWRSRCTCEIPEILPLKRMEVVGWWGRLSSEYRLWLAKKDFKYCLLHSQMGYLVLLLAGFL
jgi:hypothetical protein